MIVVSLTGTVSDQGTQDTYFAEWQVLKNGSVYATGNGLDIPFAPDDNGTYQVTLTATDDDSGVGVTTETIDVINTAPVVTDLAISHASINEGESSAVTGMLADDGPVDTFRTGSCSAKETASRTWRKTFATGTW